MYVSVFVSSSVLEVSGLFVSFGGVRSFMMRTSRVEIPPFHMMIFTCDLVHHVESDDKYNIDNIRYHLNFDVYVSVFVSSSVSVSMSVYAYRRCLESRRSGGLIFLTNNP